MNIDRYSFERDMDGYPSEYRDATGRWVRYEDAEALQMRVIELEQKLKTQDELKAELEKDLAYENKTRDWR